MGRRDEGHRMISDEEIAAAKAAGRFKSREELRATASTDRLDAASPRQADTPTQQPGADAASEPATGDLAPLPVEGGTGAADEPADRSTAAQEPAVAPAAPSVAEGLASLEPNPW